MTPFILLALGLFMVFIEFFVPGGILGIAGGVLIVVSIVMFIVASDSVLAVVGFIALAIALTAALIKFAIWRIQTKKGGGSLFLHDTQEGYAASEFVKEYIGKEGVTLSDLKPAGHILIEGKRIQAVSKTGYLVKGSAVIVVAGQGAHLIVKRKEERAS